MNSLRKARNRLTATRVPLQGFETADSLNKITFMRHQLLYVLPLLALTACATTPTPISEAKPTPGERIYFQSVENQPAATAIFIRDRGLAGSGVYQHLSVNGKKAASIDVGEKATLRLAAGEYVFGIMPTDPFGTHAEFSIDQRLDHDRVYTYRILTDGNTLTSRIQVLSPLIRAKEGPLGMVY